MVSYLLKWFIHGYLFNAPGISWTKIILFFQTQTRIKVVDKRSYSVNEGIGTENIHGNNKLGQINKRVKIH